MRVGFCCFAIIWKKYAEQACIIHEEMGVAVMCWQSLLHLQSKQTLPRFKKSHCSTGGPTPKTRKPRGVTHYGSSLFLIFLDSLKLFCKNLPLSAGSLSVDVPSMLAPSINCTMYLTTENLCCFLWEQAIFTTISLNLIQLKGSSFVFFTYEHPIILQSIMDSICVFFHMCCRYSGCGWIAVSCAAENASDVKQEMGERSASRFTCWPFASWVA